MDVLTNLLWLSFCNMYQIIMLHTLNPHNVLCQLYLNKTEKNSTYLIGLLSKLNTIMQVKHFCKVKGTH